MASFYPSQLLVVGIGGETVYGTAVAPAMWCPVSSCAPVDNMAPMPDAAWRGPGVDAFGYSPGTLDGSVALGGPVFADVIGFPLLGVLGDMTRTGGSAPFTYTFADLNGGPQPPSFTIVTQDPTGPLAWAGGMFSSLAFDYSADALLTWQATVQGLAAATTTAGAPAFTTPPPLPGWKGTVTIGGTATGQMLEGAVTMSSAATPKRNTNGTQAPYTTWAGITSVQGSFTAVAPNDVWRAQYVQGGQTSIDLNWSFGTGAALTSLQIHSTQAVWTSVAREYGSDWIELAMSFSANANTTDIGASGGQSAVRVTLKNAVASGIY